MARFIAPGQYLSRTKDLWLAIYFTTPNYTDNHSILAAILRTIFGSILCVSLAKFPPDSINPTYLILQNYKNNGFV